MINAKEADNVFRLIAKAAPTAQQANDRLKALGEAMNRVKMNKKARN